MLVGVCTIRIMLFEANSLKEKRHVVKSVIERVKSRFNVSIAEVGQQDKWQVAEIGFSCVTNSRRHADEIINNVVRFIEGDGRFDVTAFDMEIL